MKIKTSKKTFTAFESKEIKTAQQLEVKGGDGEGTAGFIGNDDIVIV